MRSAAGSRACGSSLRGPFFNEFVVESDAAPERIEKALADKGIALRPAARAFLGREYKNCMLYCCTEMNTRRRSTRSHPR